MEFRSCARVRQWCGISHYHWWTASIKPRLLFSRAGYASWGLSFSSVYKRDNTEKNGFITMFVCPSQGGRCLLQKVMSVKITVVRFKHNTDRLNCWVDNLVWHLVNELDVKFIDADSHVVDTDRGHTIFTSIFFTENRFYDTSCLCFRLTCVL